MTLLLAISLACVLVIAVFLAAGMWHVMRWCRELDARLHQLDAPDREVPLPGTGARP
jgi:hypothetical protein